MKRYNVLSIVVEKNGKEYSFNAPEGGTYKDAYEAAVECAQELLGQNEVMLKKQKEQEQESSEGEDNGDKEE